MINRKEFTKRFNHYEIEEGETKKKFDTLANARLFFFLFAIAISTYLYINSTVFNTFFAAVIFILGLVLIIIKHSLVKEKLNKARGMKEINNNYLKRLDGGWVDFQDCGEDFVDLNHAYSSDLDIFGAKSLFQWINVANTYYGRKALKVLLTEPHKTIEAINKRQEAVKELSTKIDFVQDLQWQGSQSKEIIKDPEKLLTYAEDTNGFFERKLIKAIMYILPVSLLLTVVLILTGSEISFIIPIAIMVLQYGLAYLGYRKTSKILNTVYGFKKNLEVYKKMLLLIEAEDFQAPYLNELKEAIESKGNTASKTIEDLEKISGFIDLRHNPLIYAILNATLLWDYHCVFFLEDWKKKYGKEIRRLLHIIGDYEAISSLSVVGQLYPKWCFPSFESKGLCFSAIEMGHPLIKKEDCKCNDMTIDNFSGIITGSNMSGKTTLLRTVGINLVLAYSGAPVYANNFKASIMDIFTSMRISDDLSSGISTFYAELLRIKLIIDYSHKKKPMIYLIDEMFRGTNSKDRIIGAQTVLRELNKDWIIGLVSTHDFELCQLENENNIKIKNYHFTEHYSNNKIKFDYLLRRGRCTTTNAKYLMRMVGINISE